MEIGGFDTDLPGPVCQDDFSIILRTARAFWRGGFIKDENEHTVGMLLAVGANWGLEWPLKADTFFYLFQDDVASCEWRERGWTAENARSVIMLAMTNGMMIFTVHRSDSGAQQLVDEMVDNIKFMRAVYRREH